MQKSEKTAEPSMEEILASIRKIIAEEPPQAPQQPTATPSVPQPDVAHRTTTEAAHPPGDDLSDILEEPATGAKVQETTSESSASEPGAAVASESSTALEAGLTKSTTQSVEEETLESPLMARLRGLAGAPNVLARETNVRSDTNGLGLTEKQNELGSPEVPTPAVDATEIPSSATAFSASPSSDAVSKSEPAPIKVSGTSTPIDSAASIFGKSAAAGIDPVAITITSEEASSAIADSALQSPDEPGLAPLSSAIAEAEPDVEKLERAAPASVDNVFASLTEAPVVEEIAEAQEQPILPHQEVADDQLSEEPAEGSQAEPIVPVPTPAAAEPVTPDTIVEKKPQRELGPSADLEVALAALMEPIVDRWLNENVPGIVERVLAEKMSDK
ncbi:MAG: hypothetical protein AAF346_01930 [Pseudomonadota bacterium]